MRGGRGAGAAALAAGSDVTGRPRSRKRSPATRRRNALSIARRIDVEGRERVTATV
jgi:hypothetical protein